MITTNEPLANYQSENRKDYLLHIIEHENAHLKKLNKLVSDFIKEEELLTQNIYVKTEKSETIGHRVADKVATFGGSWKFIISFGVILVVWITINSAFTITTHFDPYPYILLNLILSCIAAIQAPVIMMSQNRKEEKDRKRAESDYLINLKAEIEIRNLHQKVDLLMLEQFKHLIDIQKQQLNLLNDIKDKT